MTHFHAFNLTRQMAATAAAQTPRYCEQFNEDGTITIIGRFEDEEAGERWAAEYRQMGKPVETPAPKPSKLDGVETEAQPKKTTLKNLLRGNEPK